MGSFSIWHWLLVLLVIVLIFGTRKLKDLGKDLGESVRNFKNAFSEDKKDTNNQNNSNTTNSNENESKSNS